MSTPKTCLYISLSNIITFSHAPTNLNTNSRMAFWNGFLA